MGGLPHIMADVTLDTKHTSPAGWRRVVAFSSGSALIYVLSFLIGVAVWELIAAQLPGVVFATPSEVTGRLIEGLANGEISGAFVNSLRHMIVGLALAIAVAVPLGFLVGRNEAAFHIADPIVNAFFAIPSVAFVPFLIVWFGLFYEGRVSLVFIMCVFDILVTVSAGARNIDRAMLSVGRSFGASRWHMFAKVMLPASLPFLFTALRIGLVRAINAMITAELFFATVNLGAYLEEASARFDAAGMLAIVFLLALFGLGAQEAIKFLERRLLPWHVRN